MKLMCNIINYFQIFFPTIDKLFLYISGNFTFYGFNPKFIRRDFSLLIYFFSLFPGQSKSIIINSSLYKHQFQDMFTAKLQDQYSANITSDNVILVANLVFQTYQSLSSKYMLQKILEIDELDFIGKKYSRFELPMVRSNHFYFSLKIIFQHMDQIKCDKTTIYLCRIYIDLFLISGYPIMISQLQLLGMSAIILSIKFNESFDYPLKSAVITCGGQYTIQQISNFQQVLYRSLKFKLKYTTPFCYLKNLQQMVPCLDNQFIENLQTLIHYCCAIYSLANFSSGQIIFACCLYLCQKYANISNNIKLIIECISKRFDNVVEVTQILKNYLEVEDAQTDLQILENRTSVEQSVMEIQQ